MKRCFNTGEAMVYLGVGRRFFENNIMPMLAGKSTRAGTAVIYERADLDSAWERYKLVAGNERANSEKGIKKWDVQKQQVSTGVRPADTTLMPSTGNSGFEKTALRVIKQQQTS